jgi:RNA polymerase sigma-70 factor (ECF subfamily)
VPSAPTDTARPALADADLDRRWLSGDPAAMAEAHRRYRVRLEAVAYRIVRNRADAEDIVQRIFLALPRAAYRGSASLWSYLYRAATNGSVNVIRARRRQNAAAHEVLAQALVRDARRVDGPEARVLEGEILAAVAKALLDVRPQHRRVLVLRIIWGLSNTEIAAQEDLPVATVGTWLRRGREELRKSLRPLLRDLERSPE